MLTCVIFDLFRTLVHPPLPDEFISVLTDRGIHISSEALPWISAGFPLASACLHLGADPSRTLHILLRRNSPSITDALMTTAEIGGHKGPIPKGLVAETREVCRTTIEMTRLDPQARFVLSELKARNVRLGLASNTISCMTGVVKHHGLHLWFPSPTFSCVIGITKPNARLFLGALSAAHCGATQAVMVGDTWTCDIVGALRVNMKAIFLDQSGGSPVHRLFQDVSSFWTVGTIGEVRCRPEVRDLLSKSLPVPIETIEASPADHLNELPGGQLIFNALRDVRTVASLSEILHCFSYSRD